MHPGDRAVTTARACIFGCEGLRLTPDEVAFFAEADPWGFIVFARNIETPDQLRALCGDLRDTVGREAPILIDQEGGRVQRLRAPHWREWKAPLEFCKAAGVDVEEAMYLRGRLIASELRSVGLDVNCAPMLDVATNDSHPIILDRCYGFSPDIVSHAGRAMSEGMLAGGVLSVAKHIPGHGRASVDSHEGLPRLQTPKDELETTDFAPFKALADLPMAMTAHVVFEALDTELCATLSPTVIATIRGRIGFDGLLMTDDLSMKALSGTYGERADAALAAGCDVILHCNGDRAEMEPIAAHTPRLSGLAQARASAALAMRHRPGEFDPDAAFARLAEIESDAA